VRSCTRLVRLRAVRHDGQHGFTAAAWPMATNGSADGQWQRWRPMDTVLTADGGDDGQRIRCRRPMGAMTTNGYGRREVIRAQRHGVRRRHHSGRDNFSPATTRSSRATAWCAVTPPRSDDKVVASDDTVCGDFTVATATSSRSQQPAPTAWPRRVAQRIACTAPMVRREALHGQRGTS
jgi:hypothetical protein